MNILDDLNPPQRAAVETVDGPLLILAGPGSGKTRVIAHRIAYLVDVAGVEPWRIVAVTFTNKAAREMRSRVEAHLAGAASELVLGTFHSICARLLRVEADRIGLSRSFNIFDDADQMTLMKRVVAELGIDTKRFKERALLSAISRAKSELQTPEDCARSTSDYFQELVARCYERYDELLAANSALDFDDLIMKAVEMLRDNNWIREKYQDRFLHVLVDEFQDTNVAQYRLARLLAGKHGNICVVGDPDQSIYSWRSADIRNILDFERDFPQARIVLLEQNYRSTQTILDAAHAVIAGSKERKQRSLWTDRGAGEPIVTYEAYDEEEEASFVAKRDPDARRGRPRPRRLRRDVPHERAVARHRGGADRRRHPLPARRRHALLRAPRDQGPAGVHAPRPEPVRRRQLHARRQRARPRHRHEDHRRTRALGEAHRRAARTRRCNSSPSRTPASRRRPPSATRSRRARRRRSSSSSTCSTT